VTAEYNALRREIELQIAERRKAENQILISIAAVYAWVLVIPPFLRGLGRRIYAAIFSFWAGVIPPLPILGRS